jgi:acetyl esterase/lipase
VRALAGRPVVIDGQRLDAETQVGLRLVSLSENGAPRTPAAARAETARSARAVTIRVPAVGAVRDLTVAGGLSGRLYEPTAPAGGLLVFFHGGGYVVGDLDTHDLPCRVLCERSGARVLSVAYRLAPEHRFPAAVDDALDAFRWAQEHIDADRIAVGGDSAGGTLATVVARLADPDFQLLVYPGTDWDAQTPSRARFADGFLLTAEDIAFYRAHYLPDDAAARDPRASPLRADDLAGVARALVITAEFDPLRDEGEAYAARLEAAGVPVTLKRYDGLVHGFFRCAAVLAATDDALTLAATSLADAMAE